jgi:hypothetical protein
MDQSESGVGYAPSEFWMGPLAADCRLLAQQNTSMSPAASCPSGAAPRWKPVMYNTIRLLRLRW